MKYKVGDKVIIKDWDELVRDYCDGDGEIVCDGLTFASQMKEYCKQVMTIDSIENNRYKMCYCAWLFSDDMIAGKFNDAGHDAVNHPKHYNREGGVECFDEFAAVFGIEAAKHACLFNVWKYRYRAADKNGEEDLRKSDFYMTKYLELCKTNV